MRLRQDGPRQQVDVYPPETASGQAAALDELESFVVLDGGCLGERSEETEHLTTIGQPPASELPHDERMAEHQPVRE